MILARDGRHNDGLFAINQGVEDSRTPVAHDITLKAELFLQKAVKYLAILTGVRSIDSVVRAHYARHAGLDSICKRPEVKLVDSAVVSVLTDRLNTGPRSVGVRRGAVRERRVSLTLLLVEDKVLSTCLQADTLQPRDGLSHTNSGQIWVRGETLPVTSAECGPTERTRDRSQDNMSTLGLEF